MWSSIAKVVAVFSTLSSVVSASTSAKSIVATGGGVVKPGDDLVSPSGRQLNQVEVNVRKTRSAVFTNAVSTQQLKMAILRPTADSEVAEIFSSCICSHWKAAQSGICKNLCYKNGSFQQIELFSRLSATMWGNSGTAASGTGTTTPTATPTAPSTWIAKDPSSNTSASRQPW